MPQYSPIYIKKKDDGDGAGDYVGGAATVLLAAPPAEFPWAPPPAPPATLANESTRYIESCPLARHKTVVVTTRAYDIIPTCA
eukprot:SAG11_NODE_15762_length_567_cov_0.884615_1_plen_83_part_00